MSQAQTGLSSSDLAAFCRSDRQENISPELHALYMTGVMQDLDKLEMLLGDLERSTRPWRDCMSDMRAIVHNIKGQGTSFGYPLMTGIGESLYRMVLAMREQPAAAVVKVLGAHVEALRTIIDHDIRANAGSLGREVVTRLTSLVDKVGR